jgi:hypothetical protein
MVSYNKKSKRNFDSINHNKTISNHSDEQLPAKPFQLPAVLKVHRSVEDISQAIGDVPEWKRLGLRVLQFGN